MVFLGLTTSWNSLYLMLARQASHKDHVIFSRGQGAAGQEQIPPGIPRASLLSHHASEAPHAGWRLGGDARIRDTLLFSHPARGSQLLGRSSKVAPLSILLPPPAAVPSTKWCQCLSRTSTCGSVEAVATFNLLDLRQKTY